MVCDGRTHDGGKGQGVCDSACAKTVNGHAYNEDWCYTTSDRMVNTPEWCWCRAQCWGCVGCLKDNGDCVPPSDETTAFTCTDKNPEFTWCEPPTHHFAHR